MNRGHRQTQRRPVPGSRSCVSCPKKSFALAIHCGPSTSCPAWTGKNEDAKLERNKCDCGTLVGVERSRIHQGCRQPIQDELSPRAQLLAACRTCNSTDATPACTGRECHREPAG